MIAGVVSKIARVAVAILAAEVASPVESVVETEAIAKVIPGTVVIKPTAESGLRAPASSQELCRIRPSHPTQHPLQPPLSAEPPR